MRPHLLFFLLAFLTATAFSWDKQDHEIFDLVSALENAEGKGTNFYSWLDVPPTASTSEIAKAYRKLSMQLHPDKNPGLKGAHERFARLGVIASILRNAENRKRYDFFYKNGVPKWRGTGYYYSRFRPGLWTVVIFLTIFTSLLQLIVQRITYRKDLARIELIINRAKRAAWGPKMIPLKGQRKIRVNLGEQYDEDGFIEGSKYIEMVVDGQNVFIPDEDGTLHLVDNSTATPPSIGNTWFISYVRFLFYKVTKKKDNAEEDNVTHVQTAADEDSDHTPSFTDSSGNSTPRENVGKDAFPNSRILPTEKAGGRRRKANKRR